MLKDRVLIPDTLKNDKVHLLKVINLLDSSLKVYTEDHPKFAKDRIDSNDCYFIKLKSIKYPDLENIKKQLEEDYEAESFPAHRITIRKSKFEQFITKREKRLASLRQPEMVKKIEERKNDEEYIRKKKEYAQLPYVKQRKAELTKAKRIYHKMIEAGMKVTWEDIKDQYVTPIPKKPKPKKPSVKETKKRTRNEDSKLLENEEFELVNVNIDVEPNKRRRIE